MTLVQVACAQKHAHTADSITCLFSLRNNEFTETETDGWWKEETKGRMTQEIVPSNSVIYNWLKVIVKVIGVD